MQLQNFSIHVIGSAFEVTAFTLLRLLAQPRELCSLISLLSPPLITDS